MWKTKLTNTKHRLKNIQIFFKFRKEGGSLAMPKDTATLEKLRYCAQSSTLYILYKYIYIYIYTVFIYGQTLFTFKGGNFAVYNCIYRAPL